MTDADPFSFAGLTYIATQQESMQLNHREGASVIIPASGMCENGRVLHHLRHSVEDPKNTVVIIGYRAEHTLGKENRRKASLFETSTIASTYCAPVWRS